MRPSLDVYRDQYKLNVYINRELGIVTNPWMIAKHYSDYSAWAQMIDKPKKKDVKYTYLFPHYAYVWLLCNEKIDFAINCAAKQKELDRLNFLLINVFLETGEYND